MTEFLAISIGSGILFSYYFYKKFYNNYNFINNDTDIENNNITNLIDICKNEMNNNIYNNTILSITERFRLIEYINTQIYQIDNSNILSWISKFTAKNELNNMKEYLLNPNKYHKNYKNFNNILSYSY